jgi:hypothetical protein
MSYRQQTRGMRLDITKDKSRDELPVLDTGRVNSERDSS